MARGWESKSVEEQQAEFVKSNPGTTKRKSPVEQERARQVKTLQLTRSYILHQMEQSKSERHKQLLSQEIQHLDLQIAAVQNGGNHQSS
jgi:hypothetical protein